MADPRRRARRSPIIRAVSVETEDGSEGTMYDNGTSTGRCAVPEHRQPSAFRERLHVGRRARRSASDSTVIDDGRAARPDELARRSSITPRLESGPAGSRAGDPEQPVPGVPIPLAGAGPPVTPLALILRGTSHRDALRGKAGNDLIKARRRRRPLFGMAGNDKLYGQTGNDKLTGGRRAGRDRRRERATTGSARATATVDTIVCGAGRDTVDRGQARSRTRLRARAEALASRRHDSGA